MLVCNKCNRPCGTRERVWGFRGVVVSVCCRFSVREVMEMKRPEEGFIFPWHRAINKFCTEENQFPHFMYLAKSAADEVPRLAMLFDKDRREDLGLVCCLGVKCRECRFLAAVETDELQPQEIDLAKAWTCMAHILTCDGEWVDTSEGFIQTAGDRAYWSELYTSLAGANENEPE